MLAKDGWEGGNFIVALDQLTQSRVYGRLDDNLLGHIESEVDRTMNNRNYRILPLARRAQVLAHLEDVDIERKTSSPPHFHLSNNKKNFFKVQLVIHRLLEEGVKPTEITVLTLASRATLHSSEKN